MDLAGKRVLITGASRGIGAECAKAFAGAGASLALAARSEAPLKELVAELGGQAYVVDLSDPHEVDGFVARVEEDGPIDVLVNNAGVETTTIFEEIDESEIQQVIALNLVAPLRLTRQVLPGMIERGRGHVVQVSSLAAVAQMPGGVVYNATKAGLTHSASTIELELKGTDVGITTVHLGPVDTAMIERCYEVDRFSSYWKRLHRLQLIVDVKPDQVAADIVKGVQKAKRFVLHPKRGALMQLLNDTPRRMVSASLAGLKFR
jgi:uncharacterized protein